MKTAKETVFEEVLNEQIPPYVYFRSDRQTYSVEKCINGQTHHFGLFESLDLAICVKDMLEAHDWDKEACESLLSEIRRLEQEKKKWRKTAIKEKKIRQLRIKNFSELRKMRRFEQERNQVLELLESTQKEIREHENVPLWLVMLYHENEKRIKRIKRKGGINE